MHIDKLEQLLKGPLPGEDAHILMAPAVRFTGNRMPDPANARASSVLILLCKKKEQWTIPFIQRPVYDGVHSGQISFPGGKCEAGDHDYLFTALRETREEIGIEPYRVKPLGALTPLYIPNSNFYVYPQVGWIDEELEYVPDPLEVEEVIEVSVNRLLDKRNTKTYTWKVNESTISAPYYDADGKKIWGATAMMLSEMLEIIRKLS
jgi:8-oxo-dGTP pyrophosphatase MutT (NUDIX family)